jgi:hypothetical protein
LAVKDYRIKMTSASGVTFYVQDFKAENDAEAIREARIAWDHGFGGLRGDKITVMKVIHEGGRP